MKRMPILNVYRDAAGEYRWRLIGASKRPRILADGGEGYKTRAGAERAALGLEISVNQATVRHTQS